MTRPFPDIEDVDPVSGFTMAEKECHDALQLAYKNFLAIPRQHPDEMRDWGDAFHRLQDLLAIRIVRRCYPRYWPTHSQS